MTGPVLRVLSLGAGVQSTAVLLLSAQGRIPAFDVALFADIGWESGRTYAHLARLTDHAQRVGSRSGGIRRPHPQSVNGAGDDHHAMRRAA